MRVQYEINAIIYTNGVISSKDTRYGHTEGYLFKQTWLNNSLCIKSCANGLIYARDMPLSLASPEPVSDSHGLDIDLVCIL